MLTPRNSLSLARSSISAAFTRLRSASTRSQSYQWWGRRQAPEKQREEDAKAISFSCEDQMVWEIWDLSYVIYSSNTPLPTSWQNEGLGWDALQLKVLWLLVPRLANLTTRSMEKNRPWFLRLDSRWIWQPSWFLWTSMTPFWKRKHFTSYLFVRFFDP